MLYYAIHSMPYTQMIWTIQITSATSTDLHWISKHHLLTLKNVSLLMNVSGCAYWCHEIHYQPEVWKHLLFHTFQQCTLLKTLQLWQIWNYIVNKKQHVILSGLHLAGTSFVFHQDNDPKHTYGSKQKVTSFKNWKYKTI